MVGVLGFAASWEIIGLSDTGKEKDDDGEGVDWCDPLISIGRSSLLLEIGSERALLLVRWLSDDLTILILLSISLLDTGVCGAEEEGDEDDLMLTAASNASKLRRESLDWTRDTLLLNNSRLSVRSRDWDRISKAEKNVLEITEEVLFTTGDGIVSLVKGFISCCLLLLLLLLLSLIKGFLMVGVNGSRL